MNNTLSKIITFTAGAAIGSAVTWKLVKDKYERLNIEDAQAVRDFYNNKQKESLEETVETDDEPDEEIKEPTQRDVYKNFVQDTGYGNLSSGKIKEEEDEDVSEPYIISPSEYGECDYDEESLWYYERDGIVTTYFGEPLSADRVEELIGADFADHYGEYEEDSVHVRNDKLKTDYEILRDLGAFSEK